MAKVEIYTTMICPYCYRAKRLLDERQVQYEEIDVMADSRRRSEMVQRAGGRTPSWRIPGVGRRWCSGPVAGLRCRRSSSTAGTSAAATIYMRLTAPGGSPPCWP